MNAKLALYLAVCMTITIIPVCSHAREELVVKESVNGVFRPDDKSLGLITIRPLARKRDVSLQCEALSIRAGDDDKWLKLVIESNIAGILFQDMKGVDNATRIKTGSLKGTLPNGVEGSIRIDHTNHFAEAMDLTCYIAVE